MEVNFLRKLLGFDDAEVICEPSFLGFDDVGVIREPNLGTEPIYCSIVPKLLELFK